MGILAGRYLDWDGKQDTYPAGSRAALDVKRGKRGKGYAERVTPKAVEVGNKFVKMAREIGLSPDQMALLWTKDQPGITAPIIGSRTPGQLELSLEVLGMKLDDSIVAACDELVPPGTHVTNFFNTALWGGGKTNVPWPDGMSRT